MGEWAGKQVAPEHNSHHMNLPNITKYFRNLLTAASDHPPHCPGSLVIKTLQKVLAN